MTIYFRGEKMGGSTLLLLFYNFDDSTPIPPTPPEPRPTCHGLICEVQQEITCTNIRFVRDAWIPAITVCNTNISPSLETH